MAERPIHVTSTGSDTDGLREFPDGSDAGLLIPTHTTAQRNSSPSTGEIAYNSTLAAFEFYNGSGWISLASAPSTTEEIQDIVGAMFTSNTETRIAATYEDSDGTIDLVVTDMTANDNTQLSQEQVEDFVGGMLDGTETFITVGYDDTNGNLDFVVPVKDEDNMSSDSATFLATQQSIKAYVDSKTSGLADVGLIVALG